MVVRAWKTNGVIGSSMTGYGLGDCTISLVNIRSFDTFIEKVGEPYESITGIKPQSYIVKSEIRTANVIKKFSDCLKLSQCSLSQC